MNCIPEAVELGAAASQSQWQAIQEIIDKCDYYVVIAGGRYGTIVPSAIVPNPDGVSFTEMEYRHAKARKIPVLAFLRESSKSMLVGEKENDGETDEKRGKFRMFRSLLETECKAGYWGTTDQLRLEVATALPPLLAKSDRPGWVRGDSMPESITVQQGIPGISEFDNLVFSSICKSLMEDGMHGTKFIPFREKTVKTVENLKEEHTEKKVVGALERLSNQGMLSEFVHYIGGRHEPEQVTIYGAMEFFAAEMGMSKMDSLRVKIATFIRDSGHGTMYGQVVYGEFGEVSSMLVDCILTEIEGEGGFKLHPEFGHMTPTVIIGGKVIGVLDGYIARYSGS